MGPDPHPAGGSPASGLGLGVGLVEWLHDEQRLEWDRAAAELFGADPAEDPLTAVRRAIHPDDAERVRTTFAGLRTGSSVECSFRVLGPGGAQREVLARGTATEARDDGRPVRVVGVVVDVSASRDADRRVAETLEAMSDGFVGLDAELRFTFLNRQAVAWLGNVAGTTLTEAFPTARDSELERVCLRVLADGAPALLREFYSPVLQDWFEVRVHRSPGGLALYFHDVGERHRADVERAALLATEQAARASAEHSREALRHQAMHDLLTGLPNRRALTAHVEAALAVPDARLTVLFVDLDRFKLVNDSQGHAAGDEVLRVVADRLRPLVEPPDLVARLGGDEFVVVLHDAPPERAERLARRLQEAVRAPMTAAGQVVALTASIGLARSGRGATVATLLRDADVALYRAKPLGGGLAAWFDAAGHRGLLERVAVERGLRVALDTGAITVAYQPIHALAPPGGSLVGAEALARWVHPELGPVSPALFVPVAEDAGLVGRLFDDVLAQVCRAATARASGTLWVNVSARQLSVPGLAGRVVAQLAAAGVAPGRVGLEVTESGLVETSAAVGELAALADAGVPLAIDDFGTGYSSLSRLVTLPIGVLKIDRSFVAAVAEPRGRAAVGAVVDLAHALGMTTTAEGIETPAQLDAVRAAGSDHGSGYLLGRPAPLAELAPG